MIRFPLFGALALTSMFGALTASRIEAQAVGRIRGVAYDSLVRRAPAAGAQVELISSGARVNTDSRGRFEFDNVPAGEQRLRLHAPWLDSLLAPSTEMRVNVRGGRATEPRLATPSAQTFRAQVCGPDLDQSVGVLQGNVVTASGRPASRAALRIQWVPTFVRPAPGRSRVITVPTPSILMNADSTGRFVACGVPREGEMVVVAAREDEATNEIRVRLVGQVLGRLDLRLGRPEIRSTISGRVVRTGGAPIAEARVQIIGDSLNVARTDADGRFTLGGVPRRSVQLQVRSLGLVASLPVLVPDAELTDIGEVEMKPVSADLEQMLVFGRLMTRDQLAFEERRAIYTGDFYDESYLERIPSISAYNFPSTTVKPAAHDRFGTRIQLRAAASGLMGGGVCWPKFFVNGVMVGILRDSHEESQILRPAKRVEIYLARHSPAAYFDPDGCGAVVVWYR